MKISPRPKPRSAQETKGSRLLSADCWFLLNLVAMGRLTHGVMMITTTKGIVVAVMLGFLIAVWKYSWKRHVSKRARSSAVSVCHPEKRNLRLTQKC